MGDSLDPWRRAAIVGAVCIVIHTISDAWQQAYARSYPQDIVEFLLCSHSICWFLGKSVLDS